MADKTPKFVCRKSLFFIFSVATLFFFLSWFFLLGSTDGSSFIVQSPNPNSNRSLSREAERQTPVRQQPEPSNDTCDPKNAILKVFMYDLPPDFHFGLLEWQPEGNGVWPDIARGIPAYPGGLNLQHSIEYWLTLDLLSSALPGRAAPCAAVRVLDSSLADVVFVPFFSSLSYNRYSKPKPPEKVGRNKVLQERLVKFLVEQEEWKRSGGRDHIVLAHHPNSMLDSRMKLWPCMFILSDFGRYPPNVANVEKDIIAPYRHMIPNYANDSSGFDSRTTLLYFQGAIYRKDGGSSGRSSSTCSRTRRTCISPSGAYARTGSARPPGACTPPSSASTSPGTPVVQPALRRHREPLRPGDRQRRDRAPLRGRARLLGVQRVRPGLGCHQEGLPGGVDQGDKSGEVDPDVGEAEGSGGDVRVPVSVSEGRCCADGLAGGG
ncbi:putative arabinosyltransferase ARAD1 [Iris pallida]|uniref:Arabinosyltransferase ARAD1 n=1 Tax=Iris pallida TaxID=29817 RepID=A0AAX6G4B1_IRIPA|nr:putative arabinosyltransferase ARAD1 [Iris pallida]